MGFSSIQCAGYLFLHSFYQKRTHMEEGYYIGVVGLGWWGTGVRGERFCLLNMIQVVKYQVGLLKYTFDWILEKTSFVILSKWSKASNIWRIVSWCDKSELTNWIVATDIFELFCRDFQWKTPTNNKCLSKIFRSR